MRAYSIVPVLTLCLVLQAAVRVDANPPFDTSKLVPVDTSALMGSPDPLPPLEIVRSFPQLTFVRPVAIANAGDGSDRLFVCDQPGIVYVFPNKDDVEKAKVFLDIREKTRSKHFEEGLLGLAFHPKYKQNGQLFIYYSEDPQTSVISRWKVSADDPDKVDPGSEEIVIKIPQPHGNHNGGSMEFGPDGMLYFGLGDGGLRDDPKGNGQNLETLLASILRIDIDKKDEGKGYAIPPDNPFVGEAGKKFGDNVRGEIWAYGMRNPWRIHFDRETGDLWAADVGQDLWEEIDVIVKGGNYGWKVREGRHGFRTDAKTTGQPFVEPVWEYARHEGRSITGGMVYRGKRLPELQGVYLYGDFVTFNMWGLRYDRETKQAVSNQIIARAWQPITAYGEDESGEVFLAAFSAKPGKDVRKLSTGQVFKLRQGGLYRFERRKAPKVDTSKFPRLLSQTKLFSSVKELVPAPGLIPYDVNVPLWSDHAEKGRYLALPEGAKVKFSAEGNWEFPVGTVLVKTFSLQKNRLETRLLVHAPFGWTGYTYLWREDLSDAELLDSALRKEYPVEHGGKSENQEWYFPSRSDCNTCHTRVAGFVLGLNTRQLNRTYDYGTSKANQIDMLAQLGVFSGKPGKAGELEAFPEWGDPNAPVDSLARAYLDVNCSICHAPGGTGVSKVDFRYHTSPSRMKAIGVAPGQKRLGSADSKLVVPGAPQRSELLFRLMSSGNGRMPTVASSEVDWDAIAVLGAWISGMESSKK
jgi:uncharacterized repeat protein (TIGR03806 family)